ncbi:MAG: hypothetical protein KF745_12340 [Phycisphaeraceae bacterium]|nr:hypothetical protein [Phycisphaeraceae bacterium]
MANSTAEPTRDKPRRRWTAGSLRRSSWYFAALAMLSIAAWCVVARWTEFFQGLSPAGGGVGVGPTRMHLINADGIEGVLLHINRPEWSLAGVGPLWLIALAGAVGAVLCRRQALRLERRGCCPRCGYPRTGLPTTAACPECGAPMAGAGPAVS